MSFKYPEARRDQTVKDDYFGTEVKQNFAKTSFLYLTNFVDF